MPVSAKQQAFVREYLIDLNAAQAAERAGYSAHTAKQQGHRLMKLPTVLEAIQLAMAERSERTAITADQVLTELAKIGLANLSDVTDWGVREVAFGFDADGKRLPAEDIGDAAVVTYADAPFVRPINRDDLAPAVRAAVAEVSLGKDGFKIKMHDKVGALTQLGKHLGLFIENVNLRTPDGLTVLVREFTAKPASPPEDDDA